MLTNEQPEPNNQDRLETSPRIHAWTEDMKPLYSNTRPEIMEIYLGLKHETRFYYISACRRYNLSFEEVITRNINYSVHPKLMELLEHLNWDVNELDTIQNLAIWTYIVYNLPFNYILDMCQMNPSTLTCYINHLHTNDMHFCPNTPKYPRFDINTDTYLFENLETISEKDISDKIYQLRCEGYLEYPYQLHLASKGVNYWDFIEDDRYIFDNSELGNATGWQVMYKIPMRDFDDYFEALPNVFPDLNQYPSDVVNHLLVLLAYAVRTDTLENLIQLNINYNDYAQFEDYLTVKTMNYLELNNQLTDLITFYNIYYYLQQRLNTNNSYFCPNHTLLILAKALLEVHTGELEEMYQFIQRVNDENLKHYLTLICRGYNLKGRLNVDYTDEELENTLLNLEYNSAFKPKSLPCVYGRIQTILARTF